MSRAGSYTVVVSNAAGTATSSAATLTVNQAIIRPTITSQPGNQSVTEGVTATFTVVASGTPPLSYKWQRNGLIIGGQTNATLALSTVTTNQSGSYIVVVSNAAGAATSSAGTLKVNRLPVALNQAVTVTAGEPRAVILGGSDPEGANLAFKLESKPRQGDLSGTPPTLTYVANPTASGNDSFTFRVSAGTRESAIATVSLTINNEFLRMMDEAKQAFEKGQYDDAANSVKRALDLAPGDEGAKSLQARIEQAKDARRKLVEVDRVLEDLRKQLLRGAKPQWMTVPESTKRYIDSDVGLVFISQCTDVLKKIETNYAAVLDKDRKDLIKSLRSNLANRN
jgi:Arc/MetJ-type ribon-helix-helix transcriptional regulator